MLEIKNISKVYELGKKNELTYQFIGALKNVNINFRQNEFVSVLGQSGCGKTTLLNIIGGLDKYTAGDLVIDGKSTKNFTDRDWDNYRNHKVGFVFQSYNLIPHLTVFENVELALTLSGISKQERKQSVLNVLAEVGLTDKINSRPNQLSGGQMQRVAIARALINNPEIILADEPTGALDSKTSVQIMELLKIIAEKRLIVMVTHNPALAEKYSTRIVELLDGEIISDSNPFNMKIEQIKEKENKKDVSILTKTEKKETRKKERKSKMSYFTALSLSLKNLLTKKTRTFLVSFAGSIGIIGIALILALSSGFQTYVNNVQETTLTAYPLTISENYVDYSSVFSSFSTKSESKGTDKVYENEDLSSVINMMTAFSSSSVGKENKLDEFKTYIDESAELSNYINDLQYYYDYGFNIYTNSAYTNTTKVSPNMVFEKLFGSTVAGKYQDYEEDPFGLLYNNVDFLQSQYSLVAGEWPENSAGEFTENSKNQVVLMLDNNNQISDYFLYALGLKNQNNLPLISAGNVDTDDLLPDTKTFEYADLLNLTFDMVAGDKYYTDNGTTYDYYDESLYDNATLTTFVENNQMDISLEVVGIVKANSEDVASANEFAVGFTSELYNYLESLTLPTIVTEQLANQTINILTGNPFVPGESLEDNLKSFGYLNLDNPDKISFFAKDFESKQQVIDFISEYNLAVLADEAKGEDYVIDYTDLVGLLISNVSTIINAITYVLIAFVSVSLIVSSIMIGIITYISVLERIKEIGVLRSIGASKKDIKNIFTAESLIIGFSAGMFGIIVTLLFCIPINIVINSLAGLSNIAVLPIVGALVLIALSMLLTFVAGLIPARIASKKDPVVALRTE